MKRVLIAVRSERVAAGLMWNFGGEAAILVTNWRAL